jgi:hypothetical protein
MIYNNYILNIVLTEAVQQFLLLVEFLIFYSFNTSSDLIFNKKLVDKHYSKLQRNN